MKYTIVNPEDIPDDLPVGTYNTQIVEASWDEIKVKFLGTEYNSSEPACLLPMIKETE